MSAMDYCKISELYVPYFIASGNYALFVIIFVRIGCEVCVVISRQLLGYMVKHFCKLNLT
jgi:hypothetical protein